MPENAFLRPASCWGFLCTKPDTFVLQRTPVYGKAEPQRRVQAPWHLSASERRGLGAYRRAPDRGSGWGQRSLHIYAPRGLNKHVVIVPVTASGFSGAFG